MTRVFKGFRLQTDSLAEALRIVEGFRPWVTSKAQAVLDTFMDQAAKNGTNPVKAYDHWQDLREEIRTKRSLLRHVDTEFAVVLIPTEGVMLGMVYTEQPGWFGAWCEQPGVEEFSYWDHVDEPEGMPAEQWEARAKAWSVLKDQPVSMQGFAIELVSPDGPRPKHWYPS